MSVEKAIVHPPPLIFNGIVEFCRSLTKEFNMGYLFPLLNIEFTELFLAAKDICGGWLLRRAGGVQLCFFPGSF